MGDPTSSLIPAAVEAVRSGQVVGVPTDTVYGIGVDPANEAAVARLYEIKGGHPTSRYRSWSGLSPKRRGWSR